MQRIGPTAAAPRYAAGNYNDWSGPLERIDPAAPPSQYGLPSPYATDEQHGWNGQYERPRAEPRYERTGEIDRSGQNPSGRYSQGQYSQGQYAQPQYGVAAGQPSYGASPQYSPPGYARPPYGQEGQPGQPMSGQRDQFGGYERPHQAQYQSPQYAQAHYEEAQRQPGPHQPGPHQPGQYQRGQYQETQYQQAGYQPPAANDRGGQPGQYQAPGQYEDRMQYDSYDQYPPGSAGGPGQYGRPDSDPRERADHYASFADQDATYTRPRPPGALDQFSPQDETDPLNVVPLNSGNYS
jgi:hypothetical protein